MTNPRPLTKDELNLMEFYSRCQLGMSPQRFHSKWSLTYEQIALICNRSVSHVRFWFSRGRNYRRPTSNDLRHLALVDFLLEHKEDIPPRLWSLLCPPHQDE
jgi:hypothetical protein